MNPYDDDDIEGWDAGEWSAGDDAPTGICLNCSTLLFEDGHFCSSSCDAAFRRHLKEAGRQEAEQDWREDE